MIKLILVLVISYISLSNACSCFLPVGWQKQAYCNSEFAGTIKVLSSEYNCDTYKLCYDIQVVQQYKGITATPTVLETATDSAACGVYLIPGNTYFVVTNPIDENKIGVYLCSLFEDWTQLSCCERIEKAKTYRCDGVGPIVIEPIPDLESA